MNEYEQEIARLCRIIGEDKTTISKLKDEIDALQSIIRQQHNIIKLQYTLVEKLNFKDCERKW